MKEETTLYRGGTIVGLDHAGDYDEALLVRDQRIIARGGVEDMQAAAKGEYQEVNLDGAYLLPGIVDSHPHAMHFMGYQIGTVDILDAQSFDEIIAAIQERAEHTPKGEWIICTPIGEPHYFIRRDYTSLEERRMPDRKVLDLAAPDHPVWIMAWAPRTPNVTAFNSLGLKALGIGPQTPARTCDVWVEKDDLDFPTGILRGKVNNYYGDDPYWYSLLSRLPMLPENIWELAGIAGLQAYNARGVTGLYEAHAMMPPHIEAYQAIQRKGLCTARVVASAELCSYAFSTMDYSEEEVWALFDYAAGRQQLEDDRYRINGVTLSRGGPMSQGYIRMQDPYLGPFGEMTRGKTFLPKAVDAKVMALCLDQNVRFNMVLGGYRDNDEFIEALEEVNRLEDISSKEWVMQHCYFTAPAHVKQYRKYNFHVTTSASFVYGKSQRVLEKFPNFAQDFIAMRSFVDAGINLACGSDWGPSSPWRQMALNETREDAATGCHHLLPGDNALDRLTSLQAFTRNGASVMQWNDTGKLAEGALADFVIVDRNPLEADVADLAETQVLRTVVDGQAVYDSGAIQGGPINLPPAASQMIADAMQPGTQ